MIRRLDKEGRICIPTSFRKHHKWTPETELMIELTESGVVVQPYKPGCTLCGGHNHLVEMRNGKKVCMDCIKEAKEIGND